ncbi:MAG: carboxylating nicotinate-nucleotide diphosphorylase [Candidatus Poseidoniaceae archaeon]|jgi:nicotinate-nucleotide pyrophosphorylase (carboxylating)|tara:strand:+ start:340 stop:1278 length:939 start_codon:yes stop_codon:yes gene_type:complete
MAGGAMIPHDRGHLLWTAEDGVSRMLLSSMDRWVTAILADDDIDNPMFGSSETIDATIIAKGDGIVAGTAMVDHLIQIWAPSIQVNWRASDGKKVSNGEEIANLTGCRETILLIERSILNILGHLSGIATETKKWASKAAKQIACTRKTTWGLLDKWAVHLGGGLTHRLTRNDALMIKENDLASMGDSDDGNEKKIAELIQSLDLSQLESFIEIEVRNEKEAITAAAMWQQSHQGIDGKLVVMLDNFGPERCKEMVAQLEDMGLRNAVLLEASGNITFETLDEWFECGVDVISTSAINRGVKPLDISMIVGD